MILPTTFHPCVCSHNSLATATQQYREGVFHLYHDLCSWCGIPAVRGTRIICGTCRRRYCRTCLEVNFGPTTTDKIMTAKDAWACFTCQDVIDAQIAAEEAAKAVSNQDINQHNHH